jgi:hypothetical protein
MDDSSRPKNTESHDRLDLKLTPEEIRQSVVDGRRHELLTRFEKDSLQGILPFTNEKYSEQANALIRSSLFTANRMGMEYDNTWDEIFSLGGGSIHYKGPNLTDGHEKVLVRLMALARGRSLTKPVHAFVADAVRWLGLDASGGKNYKKARQILADLQVARIRIDNKVVLRRIYSVLTNPDIDLLPDGKFFKEFIGNRYGDHMKSIGIALSRDELVSFDIGFLEDIVDNSVTGRMSISLNPVTALFFDGVNTTLLPFDVIDSVDQYGRKLLSFIASHRAGVFTIGLEKYHLLSGSKTIYGNAVKRRFKYTMKNRFKVWEEKGYIEPGWDIKPNINGDEMVSGLKLGSELRLRSTLPQVESVDIFEQQGSDSGERDVDDNDAKLAQLAMSFGVKAPAPRKRRKKADTTEDVG